MTQFIKITKEDHELMHYGKLGMKWGRRRAMNAAKAAGRATSEAAGASKASKKIASEYTRTANNSDKGAISLANEGKIFRSVAAKTYAEANRQKAKEVTDEGQRWALYYTASSSRKTMKANKLAEKYGDEETKKKVANLIKEHASKPATGWDDIFDSTDPVASAIQNTMDAAKRAKAYQQST